LVERSAVEHV